MNQSEVPIDDMQKQFEHYKAVRLKIKKLAVSEVFMINIYGFKVANE